MINKVKSKANEAALPSWLELTHGADKRNQAKSEKKTLLTKEGNKAVERFALHGGKDPSF